MFEKVSLVEFLWFWYGSNAREETSSIPVKIFNLKKFLLEITILEPHFEKISNWLSLYSNFGANY